MSSQLIEKENTGPTGQPDQSPMGPETQDSGGGPDFWVRDLGAPAQEIAHPVAGKPYNPDKARERVRGGLAAASFVLFAVFSLGVAGAVAFGGTTWDEVEGMTGTLLPAIVSVVASTTGFYFGTRAKGNG